MDKIYKNQRTQNMKNLPHNFNPYLAYSASAGSGKTFALSVRYISLLFMGESSSTILAATFTNKAAAEMRQRVVNSLRHLSDKSNEAFVDAISKETDMSREELLNRQPDVLKAFLGSASYIVTLDSFFSSILRSASLELGLEPDFITKEDGDDELERHFLNEVRAEGLLSSLVKLAMDIEDKRFLKIFDLMQSFYKVDTLLPSLDIDIVSIEKIEASCERLRVNMIKALNDAGSAMRCIKQFDTTHIKELFGKSLFQKETLGEHSWFKKVANSEIEMIYSELKNILLLWAKAREDIVLYNLFKIYDYYKNATITNVKSSGVLNFDDLTYFTYRLLHESMSREFLYFKIDAKFRHILLDEFQDTSTLQFLLLKPLIDEIFAGTGQSELRSFFYVGDTKQSLYRFRGGVEELFDKVAEHYSIKIEQMNTNYRSAKHIIEQVNRWFEPIMEDYTYQYSKDGAEDGFVEVVEAIDVIDEAVIQAKRLIDLGVREDDIAFLVSTNKDGVSLQEACGEEGINTLLKTSSSLKNQPKIAGVVAMVRYLFYGEKIDAQTLILNVGRDYKDIDLSWFSPFMTPIGVIDRLVREFGYFDEDLNILKLLEFASSFNDIASFIEEFDTSSIPLASHSIHGAKIMTIHGSKGLEFDFVIVVDKLTRKNSDKSALIFHYDNNLYIDKIVYRTKGRDSFDDEYKQIMQEQKTSSLKDSKNVLYVALTRAVEALIVIKKPKDSIFDELGMSVLSLGKLVIRPKAPQQTIEIKEEITISNYGVQDIITNEDNEERDFEAILFGTVMHYALEMLGEFDKSSLELSMIAIQNRYGQQLSQEAQLEIKTRIQTLIDYQPFRDILIDAEISKEQSLSFNGELKKVDLLLEYDDYALVVDYKSSHKYAIKHQNQVEEYKKAITNILGKETKGLIVYLLSNRVELYWL